MSFALLAVAIWVSRAWLLETWYIHRLGSKDEETRLAAAEKLGEMGSLRAVPRLVEVIYADNREAVYQQWFKQQSSVESLEDYQLWVGLTPVLYALYQIGPQGDAALKHQRHIRNHQSLATDYVSDSTGFTVIRRARAMDSIRWIWRQDMPVTRLRYNDDPFSRALAELSRRSGTR